VLLVNIIFDFWQLKAVLANIVGQKYYLVCLSFLNFTVVQNEKLFNYLVVVLAESNLNLAISV
jgi:hypothetical protein